jgi:hypothetical protein
VPWGDGTAAMHRSGAAMAWNVFRFCTALRGLGSVMILLVLAIVGVTYYALVLCSYGPALLAAAGALDALVALAVLVLFHFLVRALCRPLPLALLLVLNFPDLHVEGVGSSTLYFDAFNTTLSR